MTILDERPRPRPTGPAPDPSRSRVAGLVALVALGGVLALDLRVGPWGWDPRRLAQPSSRFVVVAAWFTIATAAAWQGRRALRTILGRRPAQLLTAALAVGLVASLVADDAARSLAIGLGAVALAAAVAVAVHRTGWATAATALWFALLVVSALSIVLGGLDASTAWERSFADPQRLRGLFAEPNVAGQLGGLLCVLSVGLTLDRRLDRGLGAAGVVIGTLVAASSLTRTILPALALTALVLIALRRRRPAAWIAGGAVVGAVAVAVVVVVVGPTEVSERLGRSPSAGELSSLGNRADLWSVSVDEIVARPLVGHGWGSGPERFGLAVDDGRLPWLYSPSSHDLPLELAREIGVPGAALAVAAAAAGATRRGAARPALTTYLAATSLLMPLTLVVGAVGAAWVLVVCSRWPDDPDGTDAPSTDGPGPDQRADTA